MGTNGGIIPDGITRPVEGEVPQIDWPVVQLAGQALIIRWSLYAQWLLSKRGVRITDLPKLMKTVDPTIVDVMMEVFAAAVAENFRARKQPVPDAEHWAITISDHGGEAKFREINSLIWQAVGKARRAAPTPEPPEAEETGADQQPN